MKRFKSFMVVLLVLVFAFSAFIPGASAQGNTAFSQEEAIEKIKGIFDTSGYDNFNINYNEDKNQKTWFLNWSKSKEPYGSLDATIDADTGYILNLNMYKGYDPDRKPSPIPRISKDEAVKIAAEFAKSHQPEEFAKTKYVERKEPSVRPFGAIYQQDYFINFVRVEKGIPVDGEGMYINVDASTGDVRNYNFNWSYEALPSSDKIISKEEAEKAFKTKVGLKLIYQRYYNYGTKSDEVKLVYTVNDSRGTFINAATGELIENGKYFPYRGDMGGAEMKNTPADQALTPQEQEEVEATKNCITKDAAVAAAKKYVTIPEGYILSNAGLYEDYNNPGQKTWNLNWNSDPKTSNTEYPGSISVRVNAVNSELISFDVYDSSRYDQSFQQKYDRTAARKIAEDFIKKVQPERFNQVKLEEIAGNDVYLEKSREHYFNFTREVNGIPYTANGFTVAVDAQSGQIINYDMRWQDRDFPKLDGALSKDEAEAAFMKDVGLELAYIRIYQPKEQTSKFYLVYRMKPSASYTFDAFNFTPLDFQGKPIKEQAETVFSDIKGHWAEKDIQLLVDMGLIQSKDDKFHPDENMSQGDFIKLLMISSGRSPVNDMSDAVAVKVGTAPSQGSDDIQKYIDAAIKAGIAKKGEIEAQKPISREKMAVFTVRSLGFDKVASISDIYSVPAKDAAAISPAYKGHAAIAMGLGLIQGVGGKFEPQGNVSRAQAAVVIVRMLKLD